MVKYSKIITALIILLFICNIVSGDDNPFIEDKEDPECKQDTETCAINSNPIDIGIGSIIGSMEHDEDKLCIIYFYSPTCSHCQNIKPFIDNIEEEYRKNISITKLDVSMPENVAAYNQICKSKEYTGNEIPLIAIENHVLVGEDEIRNDLEDEIKKGFESEEKICPLESMSCYHENATGTEEMLTGVKKISFISVLPLVMLTGLGDGINPCAFAVLLFIMAFLQEISGSKKRLKRVTISYITAFMIVNIGLGIFYYFTSIKFGHPEAIRNMAIGFAVLAGMINLKDFFAYGKGLSLEIPKFSKKYIESLAAKASIPAALIMGGLVAILEAPCSVPIYLTVLEVLKGQGKSILGVMPHILIYNIMFILPIIVLAGFIYYGAEAKALEGWRHKHRKFMKLSLALILFALAGMMVSGII